jgi:anti-sigma B factor antagonist
VQIDESPLGNITVLRPVGRLDNATSAEFQARLLQTTTAAGAADVIVDFGAVQYISSGGLRALMMAVRQKPANRRVAVTGLNLVVERIFTVSGLQQVIPIFVTIADAQRAWAEPGQPEESTAGTEK